MGLNVVDKILLVACGAAAMAVAAGCVLCLVVWIGGGGHERPTEVCPPADEP